MTPSGRRALGDLDVKLPHDVRARVAAAVMRHAEQVVVLTSPATSTGTASTAPTSA